MFSQKAVGLTTMVSHGYRGGPTLDYPSIEWEFTSMMFPIQIPSSWLTKTTRFPMLDTCSEPNLEVAKNPHRMCLRHCDMCSLSYNCWFKSSNPFFFAESHFGSVSWLLLSNFVVSTPSGVCKVLHYWMIPFNDDHNCCRSVYIYISTYTIDE